jgi:biopolymer transport protein ExbB
VFDLLVKGGIVMIAIGIASLVGAAVIIERLFYFRRIGIDEGRLTTRLKAVLEKGHFDEALAICESSGSPMANLMRAGITNRHRPASLLRDTMVDAANMEVPRLERYLSALGTVATVAPLLGLLGTVTGIINAFGVIGRFGAVGDPALLARGISEALITSAAGLVVSIPATVFFNYLVGKANHAIIRLENRANEMHVLIAGEPRGTKK